MAKPKKPLSQTPAAKAARKARKAAKAAAPAAAKKAPAKKASAKKAASSPKKAMTRGTTLVKAASYGSHKFRCYGISAKLRNQKSGPRGFCARHPEPKKK
jgi:hypothetical protein